MNAPLTGSLLSAIELAPRDPILGVPKRLMPIVARIKSISASAFTPTTPARYRCWNASSAREREIAERAAPRGYLPIDGIPVYDRAVRRCCSVKIARL
jgi:aromatic-amino-acid transaminase